ARRAPRRLSRGDRPLLRRVPRDRRRDRGGWDAAGRLRSPRPGLRGVDHARGLRRAHDAVARGNRSGGHLFRVPGEVRARAAPIFGGGIGPRHEIETGGIGPPAGIRPRTIRGVMRILLAAPRGFCAGVVRAIDVVDLALECVDPPLYVRKEIVHNLHVVRGFEERGVRFVDELDSVPDGATVIFSAHGIAPRVREEAARRGLTVIDATCPLVTKVHLEAVRFARLGYSIVLIGHPGHEEVDGTMGEAPARIALVSSVAEAEAVSVADPDRVAYITQTTLSMEDTRPIVEALKRRFPK